MFRAHFRGTCRYFALAALACTTWLSAIGAAQTPPALSEAALIGDWKGESVCLDKQSACHDETVVYHLSKGEKAGWYRASADKIVDGSAVNMGTLDFRYDAGKRTLVCEAQRGAVWTFRVDGNKMNGTLTLADKTVFRCISLTKVR
jgi:hypothetical protein